MVATSERKRTPCELPPVGTTLTARHKGRSYTAQIVEAKALLAGRGVKYRNNIFGSLRTAAKAITGYDTSGPIFWGLR